jgi:outer membrane protein assembly factor BamB
MSEAPYDLCAGNWSRTRAVAADGRQLYVLDADTHVYPVDPLSGSYGESLGRFDGDHLVIVGGEPRAFTGPTTSLGDRVYRIEDRALYAIDRDGSHQRLANSWDTRQLIGVGEHLFAWEADNALYRVDPSTGETTPLANNWPHVGGVATAIGNLYAVEGGILYQVDPRSGECAVIADRMRTRLLVGVGSSIYSFEGNGDLYRIGVG